ncbi:MAG: IS1182 family transposase [Candidatus Sulfotelmatobacter sp.]
MAEAWYKEEILAMFCWITILGGALIMMGQHDRSEALFYYFRLEDQVPETHLLRLIDKHISFAFVREKLRESYSDMGRPSIDPELLLRILLIGYLYGITSERKLVEELRMHLAWRWFTGLGFDQEIPHHSTFSKNRHGRFQESKLFEQLFERIVRQCVEVGLVKGEDLSVDGSFVEANAAKESRIPREQLAEAAQVHHTMRQYLVELERQNPVEEPVHQQDHVSTTDPDSTYATKGGTPARLGYYDNYLVDNHSCVIVGVQATAARMSQETVAAQDMIARFAQRRGREPESVAADTTYGNGEFLQWLLDRSITPYMRTRDSIHRKNNPFYGPERFTYLPESNRYLCPAGEQLHYVGLNVRNRAHAYIGSGKRCGACSQKAQCTSGRYKYLAIHMDEPARQRARELANTAEFAQAQRQRKKVEALFAELKNQIGLRRLRLRRMKFVREQFFLAAVAQNIKRLVRFLSQGPRSILPATT